MIDLVYTDADGTEQGIIKAYSLDLAYGSEENDFKLTLPIDKQLDALSFVYIDDTEWGGIVRGGKESTTGDTPVYSATGVTWHGMLGSTFICPASGEDYVTVSGEANAVMGRVLEYVGLAGVFDASADDSGIEVSHQFERFTDCYSGFRKMLKSSGAKLKIDKQPGRKPTLYAAPIGVHVDTDEACRYGYEVEWGTPVNHLICLGKGELSERTVVHLYADASGNVSRTQTLFGLDEVQDVYDYSSAEDDELIEKGTEKLEDLQWSESSKLSLPEDAAFDVDDIVGIVSDGSGRSITASVAKVIVKIDDDGIPRVTNEIGEIAASKQSGGSGGSSGGISYAAGDGIRIRGGVISADVTERDLEGKSDKSHSHTWGSITGKPDTFPPSEHSHDDRYYTESEIDSKLSGKANADHEHTAYVNQNAFSSVAVGSTTVAADSATDTLTIAAGSNVTVTADAGSDKITIAAKDTTYSAAGDSLGLVKSGGDVTVSGGVISVNDDSHNHVIENVDGLQTALDGKANADHEHTAADIKSVNASAITGTISSANLPSYVDDVLEYSGKANFPSTGEAGKIYVDTATNLTYRWSGSAYVEISASLALGETSSTAYRGDRGAAAYKHAVTNKGSAFSSGLYKITTNSEGHVTAASAVAKSDITALGIPAQDTVYTHPSSGVTAGTYKSVTVNAQGHVTGGSNPTTLSGYGITDAAAKGHDHTVSQISDLTATAAELNIMDGVTATTAEINKLDGLTSTTAELNYTDGVTSNIQTQLNGKQATITGGATTIASSNLTASRALVSDSSGKVAVSAVTSTELGYLDGVTSNIQTQLNGKSASSHTHNYAGSASAGGAAATATKLATARTVAVSGDVVGSASFDGSANASIKAVRRGCIVGQSTSTTTNPYYKVASASVSATYTDYSITFKVSACYGDSNTKLGILTAHFRTNSSGYLDNAQLTWEYAAGGIDTSKFMLAYNTGASPTVVELWAVCDSAYQQLHFDVISEGTRAARSTGLWTLYSTVSAGSQSGVTSGYTTKTSTLATLKNNTSGNASTATKATNDGSGQNIADTYIKALSVSGKVITYTKGDGDTGTITTQDTNTTYSAMTGATSSAAGASGLVPAPAAGKQASFLRGDGTWVVPTNTVYTHPTTAGNKHIPAGGSSGQILRWSADGTAVWGSDNNTTYSNATQSSAGLMSADDKKKLDGIESGATALTWQDIYPVGAVYISYASTSPASLFGGTWTAIKGRFPYFNAGTATGGSNTHTNTLGEMVIHAHGYKVALNGTQHSYEASVLDAAGYTWGTYWQDQPTDGKPYDADLIEEAGGGASYSIMPAYQTLYAWRRTA